MISTGYLYKGGSIYDLGTTEEGVLDAFNEDSD